METNHEYLCNKSEISRTRLEEVRTFFVQEVDTANGLLDLQTLGHLASFDIPEPNRLVVGTADQTFALQEQRSAVVRVTSQEADILGKGILEIRLPMVQGTIQRLPDRSMRSHRCEGTGTETYQPSGFWGGFRGMGSVAVVLKQ